MRAAAIRAAAVLALAALTLTPGLAAQAPVPDAGLERELRQLNETLRELVELLRRQLDSSNAALLMQRVQLMTARMAPVTEELQEALVEQRRLQRELDDLELSAATYESQLERQVETGDLTAEQARALIDQQTPMFEQRKKQVEDRLWTAQQRVIDLEQRLGGRRSEIETWESEIDRVLGLR